MIYKDFYKNLSEEKILISIKKEGFNPLKFFDEPGYTYPPHTHPETKLLAFLKGSMSLKAGGEHYECHPGDKVILPGNVLHEATVGPEGCEFFWSEKLL